MDLFHQAMQRLIYWRNGGNSFTCELYRLFQKADYENKAILAQAYPNESAAHSLWYAAPNEQDFLEFWKQRTGYIEKKESK